MKKGFTLIELLAVLVILGVILSMVMINASHFSSERKQKDYDNIKNIIEENTRVLLDTDSSISPNTNKTIRSTVDFKLKTNSECKISYNLLVDRNLMDEKTVNPINNKIINQYSYMKISLNPDYTYKSEFVYSEENSNDVVNCCEYFDCCEIYGTC